jgi:hypothetical protein
MRGDYVFRRMGRIPEHIEGNENYSIGAEKV